MHLGRSFSLKKICNYVDTEALEADLQEALAVENSIVALRTSHDGLEVLCPLSIFSLGGSAVNRLIGCFPMNTWYLVFGNVSFDADTISPSPTICAAYEPPEPQSLLSAWPFREVGPRIQGEGVAPGIFPIPEADDTTSEVLEEAIEGRGRPLTASSSDRDGSGAACVTKRLRHGIQCNGRPLTAAPSDKSLGVPRQRPDYVEGKGRPSSARPSDKQSCRMGDDGYRRRMRTGSDDLRDPGCVIRRSRSL